MPGGHSQGPLKWTKPRDVSSRGPLLRGSPESGWYVLELLSKEPFMREVLLHGWGSLNLDKWRHSNASQGTMTRLDDLLGKPRVLESLKRGKLAWLYRPKVSKYEAV